MKRIKRISHLRFEQKRLAHRKASLEDDIRKDWESLCHRFDPKIFARGAFFSGLSWIGRRLFTMEGHGRRDRRSTHSS